MAEWVSRCEHASWSVCTEGDRSVTAGWIRREKIAKCNICGGDL